MLTVKSHSKLIQLSLGAGFLCSLSYQPGFASGLDYVDLGIYTGTVIEIKNNARYRSFADFFYRSNSSAEMNQAKNQGWMHSAKFLTLTLGTEQDIARGETFDVQFTVAGDDSLDFQGKSKEPMDNPSFAIWTAGNGTFKPKDPYGQHGWNPTRGPNELADIGNDVKDQSFMNAVFHVIGGLNDHVGWIGFVNSGGEYTLTQDKDPVNMSPQTLSGFPIKDYVGHGGLNTTDKLWLTQPELSTVRYTNNYLKINGVILGDAPDSADMQLYGLKAGHYLIAVGGSCAYTLGAFCGNGRNFQFKVSPLSPATQPQNDQAAISELLKAEYLDVINTDAVSGQMFIRTHKNSVKAPFYAALPDVVSSTPTMTKAPGLSFVAYMPDKLKNVVVAYAVYQDSQGQLRQKALLPTPAQWEQLRIAFLNSGFTQVVLQADGIIRATASDGKVQKAFADYVVTPGDDNVTQEPRLEFAVINDVNRDGSNDLKVTYPNGDQQILLWLNQ